MEAGEMTVNYSYSAKSDSPQAVPLLRSAQSNRKKTVFPIITLQTVAPKRFCITPEETHECQRADGYGYKYLPIELFKTAIRHYIFDARNVTFLEIDPITYDVLSMLRECDMTEGELSRHLPHLAPSDIDNVYAEIRRSQRHGYLTPYRFKRAHRHADEEIEQVLSEQLAGFTVFLTTQCNLACSYCIYGGQYTQHDSLSQSKMSWETLKSTMDFLEKNSRKSDEVRIDFFGGEPLLAFQLLQKGVEYLKSIIAPSGRRTKITITSNGTVLSDRILDFLIDNCIYIQFSVDGSRQSHDKYRIFKKSQRGSFDNIYKNLARICDQNQAYYEQYVRLKGVLNTDTVAEKDTEFFDDPLIRPLLEAGHFTFVELEPHYDVSKDHDFFKRLDRLGKKMVKMKKLQTIKDINGRLVSKEANLFMHTFNSFFECQAVNAVEFDGLDVTPFIKGCMPGYKQGAVQTNGDISICLKAAKGSNFVIGNVLQNEWYFKKIKQLSHMLHDEWESCSGCFLQKICELCYEKLDGGEGEWVTGRSRFCEFNRKRYRKIFGYMLRLMENNPALWDDLQDRIIEKARSSE